MAIQLINVGAVANDGTGDTLREAFQKENANWEYINSIVLIYENNPVAPGESAVFADATAAQQNIALPDADSGGAQITTIFKTDSSANLVHITTTAAFADGSTSFDIGSQYGAITFYPDATANVWRPTFHAAAWNNGSDSVTEIRMDRIVAPSAPTVAVNATAGNLNGATTYSISFITADGETEVSAPSASVNPANQRVDLSNIPVSSDPRVIARGIYRKTVGAEDDVLKKRVSIINDNVTTTYTDNIADASLGVAAPRVNTTGGSVSLQQGGARVCTVGGISTSVGVNAMPGNRGYSNDAFGANALYSCINAFRNTAIGVYSQYSNLTGARNVGVGVHTLNDNQSGDDNTAAGYGALEHATGDGQCAFGASALAACTTGSGNNAFGYNSLRNLVDGGNNSGFGQYTLAALIDGSGNMAMGLYAAGFLQHGNYNLSLGSQSMFNATNTSSNVAVGAFALYSLTTGIGNVAIGNSAGYWETGSDKVFIDNRARTNEADARLKAPIYCEIADSMAAQKVRLNGVVQVPHLQTYADNATALANGLTAGALYTTGLGVIKVVY